MRQKPFVDRVLPGPAGGVYSAIHRPSSWIKGVGPLGRREGEGNEKGKLEGNVKGEGEGRGERAGRGNGEKGTKEKERVGKWKGEEKGQGFCLG